MQLLKHTVVSHSHCSQNFNHRNTEADFENNREFNQAVVKSIKCDVSARIQNATNIGPYVTDNIRF